MTVRHAPEPAAATAALDVLRLRAAAGLAARDLDRLPPRARRSLAVAAATGAPMLPALDAAAAAQDDLARPVAP